MDSSRAPGHILASGALLFALFAATASAPNHATKALVSTVEAAPQNVEASSEFRRVAADTTVPEYDLRAIERMVHEGINAERTDRGLPALTYADSLRRLGIVHSRDMARRGFFGHNNPDGEGVNDRASDLGLSCVRQLNERSTTRGFGENLYSGTLFTRYRDIIQNGERLRREFDWKTESEIANDVVQGWMNSPGHRSNILEKRYALEAIAVHVDGTDFFVTQIFC